MVTNHSIAKLQQPFILAEDRIKADIYITMISSLDKLALHLTK